MTGVRNDQGEQLGLPSCGDPSPGSRRLESYWSVEVPGTYWVEMVFDENAWQPAERIPMPYHQATRLELTNEAEFPSLSAHRARRLRFSLEVTSREIHKVAGRHEWRTTYSARIISACIPDPT